ncbi:MAG: 16S rRNA (cytosine(1402)-N(4))-methyltransferase RsmH [Candidatus Omnitrophota bacterium]
MTLIHHPVLLQEVIEGLELAPGKVILDATAGGGGHSAEILKKISPSGKLIAVDRDPEAVERVEAGLRQYKGLTVLINDNFKNVEKILEKAGMKKIDGAVFDLGVSSFQIDDPERGFSFLRDGVLDMRFSRGQKISAKDVVNRYGKEDIAEIIKKYGEERHAGLVAGAICSSRKLKVITTTGELADIVVRAVGRKYRGQKIHPAARTFQALRIYVNEELEAVSEALTKTVSLLNPGGRICVISFHSLEDRIVKNIFRDFKSKGELKIITKKPICPSGEEVRYNPRARSAKLRVAEKAAENL